MKLDTRRRITLPKEHCDIAGIQPGDDVDVVAVGDDHLNIVKVRKGRATPKETAKPARR